MHKNSPKITKSVLSFSIHNFKNIGQHILITSRYAGKLIVIGSGGYLSYGAVMVTQPCLCACCVSNVKLFVCIGKVF